jgi:hypothetical protein
VAIDHMTDIPLAQREWWPAVRRLVGARAVLVSEEPATELPSGWSVLPAAELGRAGDNGPVDVVLTGLEAAADPPALLAAAHALADGGRLVAVVPNLHDPRLVRALLLGRGDSQLPLGPIRPISADRLDRWAREIGRAPEVDAPQAGSDASDPGRPLDAFLAAVGGDAGAPSGAFLVRSYTSGTHAEPATVPGPFLSVLLRTRGRRPDSLAEVLLCLGAQSHDDFEVLLLAHDVGGEQREVLDRTRADLPASAGDRVRLLDVSGGGRSRPLNVGVEAARGAYVAVLDDDDLVTAHWVEAFATGARRAPGRIVRSIAVEQDVERYVGRPPGFRAAGWPRRRWDADFSLVSHIVDNHSPVHCYALPADVFTDLGLRFDESLPVLEDWDLLVRAAMLVGVVDTGEVTCVYRRWPAAETSFAEHAEATWPDRAWGVVAGWDRRPLLLPPNSASRLRADGIALLRHRPLRRRVAGRLQRSRDRWGPRLMRTRLGPAVRSAYRQVARRAGPT